MPDIFRVFADRVTSSATVQLVNLGTTSTAIIRSLTVCNTSTASTASFDVLLERTLETADFYLFRYTQVAASQTVKPIESPVVLGGGDVLKMSAGSGQVNAVATILETY